MEIFKTRSREEALFQQHNILTLAGFVSLLVGCNVLAPLALLELQHYPLDSLEGLITQSGIVLDTTTFKEGTGSIKIVATQPTTIPLFETGDLDLEATRLFYQGQLRTEKVNGKVYLEMLCHFPGKGEFFSRALQSPLSGTQDWRFQETPFILQRGENPDNIKLNVVIEGTGTLWVDDLRLVQQKTL